MRNVALQLMPTKTVDDEQYNLICALYCLWHPCGYGIGAPRPEQAWNNAGDTTP